MKKIISDTQAALDLNERRSLAWLSIWDLFVSLFDIFSLAFLLWVVRFYTSAGPAHFLIPGEHLLPAKSFIPALVLLVFFSIKNVASFRLLRAQTRFSYRVALRIARQKLQRYLECSYPDYVSVDSSVHFRGISQQPIEFAHYVLNGIQQMTTQCLLILFAGVALLLYNPALFLLLVVLTVPPSIAMTYFIMRRAASVRERSRTAGAKALQYLREAIAGYVESNVYGRQNFFSARYAESQEKLNNNLADIATLQATPSRFIEIFAAIGLLILVLLSAPNSQQIITVAAYVAAAYKIIPGIIKLLSLQAQVKAYAHSVENIAVVDNRDKSITPEPIRSLAAENISFRYGKKSLLCGVGFSLSPGDMIGITGRTGSGKTTLLHLILGFLDPHSGCIFINGKTTTADERENYRGRISYASQHALLLHDSLLNNITLGDPEPDAARLQQAIEGAALSDFLEAHNGDVHTIISESGKNISGGQAQRINIARALYRDPDVFLLDEPCSELDLSTEKHILGHFSALASKGKIVVLVSHHAESFGFCNKLLSIERLS